jgi:hypothetical protein
MVLDELNGECALSYSSSSNNYEFVFSHCDLLAENVVEMSVVGLFLVAINCIGYSERLKAKNSSNKEIVSRNFYSHLTFDSCIFRANYNSLLLSFKKCRNLRVSLHGAS